MVATLERAEQLNPGASRLTREPTRRRHQVKSARAVVWGMIDVNPANLGVDNPSPRRREQRPFESWAEVEAVAANLERRYGPMVIFAAATDFAQPNGSRSRGATSIARRALSMSAAHSRRVA